MRILNEKEAEDFLEKMGFNVNKRGFATNLNKAKEIADKIGYPVVLKNIKLLHKSDKGGVKLNVEKEDLEKNFKELKSNEVLIHKQGYGKEFLLGIKKDPTFGHVIVFGIGGIYTEMLKDVSMRVFPIERKDAVSMVENIKNKEYYDARGLKANKNMIINNILKLNELIKKNKNIKELDINPLMVDEKNAVVADARIVLE
ncbi:MAG: acetate--CoA ligase family protein [Nanoarchaeota archaeon]|nr:acetate--CoA ligase family protein [Nanoarchaeota archaeon]MBU0963047.1 acetate--CoA ligase family protein [Nanoarchaeota archaeon]